MLLLDTNILVCSLDARDLIKQATAQEVLRLASARGAAIGLQSVGEFHNGLTRRLKRDGATAAQLALRMLTRFGRFGYEAWVRRPLATASAGLLSYWDALLLSAADAADCATMLSEDMRDGCRHGGLSLVNPCAADGAMSGRAAQALSI